MCTITLEYNEKNALARRKLAALLATGLFVKKEVHAEELPIEQLQAHREIKSVALDHSKKVMSHYIARYL